MLHLVEWSWCVVLILLSETRAKNDTYDKSVMVGQGANFVGYTMDKTTRRIINKRNNRSEDYVTYGGRSSLNSNSGARYYGMYLGRYSSRESFASSYVRTKSYYYSPYGYRLKRSPHDYSPVFVDHAYYYYPPMFQYYYINNPAFWMGSMPRYVCRNDKALWPLENQTSEFYQGHLPAVNLSEFDLYRPTPFESTYTPPNAVSLSTMQLQQLNELNSLLLNQKGLDYYLQYFGTLKAMPNDARESEDVGDFQMKSSSKLLTYNYFACPDGKDPDETECCGPPTNQYCCLSSLSSIDTSSGSSSSWKDGLTEIALDLLYYAIAPIIFGIAAVIATARHYIKNGCPGSARARQVQAASAGVNANANTQPFSTAVPDSHAHTYQYEQVPIAPMPAVTQPMSTSGALPTVHINYTAGFTALAAKTDAKISSVNPEPLQWTPANTILLQYNTATQSIPHTSALDSTQYTSLAGNAPNPSLISGVPQSSSIGYLPYTSSSGYASLAGSSQPSAKAPTA